VLVCKTLPETPPKYTETQQARQARRTQCKRWRSYAGGATIKDEITSANIESISSHLLSNSQMEIAEASPEEDEEEA
jgi:hypothetical protein